MSSFSAIFVFTFCLSLSVHGAHSIDTEEIVGEIKKLAEAIDAQKTELITSIEGVKEDLREEVRNMINETSNDLYSVNRDLADLKSLLDTDECIEWTHNCSGDARCIDTRVSFRCECKPGFNGDGYTCVDIDECATGGANCGPNATCRNYPGGYSCVCESGFEKNENGTCDDIDECSLSSNKCHKYAVCDNTPGNYTCTCSIFHKGNGYDCEQVEDAKCQSPFNIIPGVGCIHIIRREQTFQRSRESCKELGSDLFVAVNPSHYLRLAQHFLDTGFASTKKYMWVGVEEGKWLNGRSVSPEEEAPNNPIMKSGTCSYTDGDSSEQYRLWTHPCSFDWWAICEQKRKTD